MSNDFKVAIFLANGYEMGEAIIIIDLLRRAHLKIDLISIEKALLVKSSHNVAILCEKLITDNHFNWNDYKMLILPGGSRGVKNLNKNALLKTNLKKFANEKTKFIAAICAAPQILGALQLLENKKVTHYPNANLGLEKSIVVDEKVVVSDNIITGKSIGCAFDFSLKIVEILLNKTASETVKKQLVF